jgi:hypothetical protein
MNGLGLNKVTKGHHVVAATKTHAKVKCQWRAPASS